MSVFVLLNTITMAKRSEVYKEGYEAGLKYAKQILKECLAAEESKGKNQIVKESANKTRNFNKKVSDRSLELRAKKNLISDIVEHA